jgi:hypothetical protein
MVKSLPPIEFSYEEAGWDIEVKDISAENLVHASIGIDDQQYAWVDLFSDGISGILSEQASA